MRFLLDRYAAGEHVAVWVELGELGASVRQAPFYSDALAVARETMRRARYNIERLVARLRLLDYQFGYDWWVAEFRDMLEYDPPPPVFARPQAQVEHQLTELERRVGILPLALRAWYEQVGAVNFVGMYPIHDATDPNGFTNYVQFTRSGARDRDKYFSDEYFSHDVDPLFVDSLDHILQRPAMPSRTGSGYEIDLAPDEWLKYGVSGGGPYVITAPNPAADAILENEWHETTFVNYLRTCFRWGGFPGLECKTRRPERELAFLTEDLLPI